MNKIIPYLKLFGFSFLLYLFFAYIGPFFVLKSEIWREFIHVQEVNNIHSGALYYTDVPVTKEAELATREGVR